MIDGRICATIADCDCEKSSSVAAWEIKFMYDQGIRNSAKLDL